MNATEKQIERIQDHIRNGIAQIKNRGLENDPEYQIYQYVAECIEVKDLTKEQASYVISRMGPMESGLQGFVNFLIFGTETETNVAAQWLLVYQLVRTIKTQIENDMSLEDIYKQLISPTSLKSWKHRI